MHVIFAMSTETCALAVDGATRRASAKIANAVLFMSASALCLRLPTAYDQASAIAASSSNLSIALVGVAVDIRE